MFIQMEELVIIKNSMEMIRLICKKINFYSAFDDDAFFEWLKKISCVSNIKGVSEELYVDVDKGKFTDLDLRETLALFYRYDIDMKQLKVFLNDENKSWFFDNKEAFWHGGVFS